MLQRTAWLWLACALGALLGGCLPSGKGDTRCAGYLGCTSTAGLVVPDGGGGTEPQPPLPPIGTGCGKPLPANQVATVPGTPTGYTHYTVMGTGATLAGPVPAKVGERTFWVRVPVDYDPNHKYQVVYLAQGCGGFNVAHTSTYRLFDEAMGGNEEAIYVALDIPTDNANQDCYDDRDGPSSQEWEAFGLFQSIVDQTYCVDNDRVDVVGYDVGGDVANMWGCYFAGDGVQPASDPTKRRVFAPQYHIRGQAGVAGLEPNNNPPCNGRVAAIWIHDLMDSTSYTEDVAARDRALRMNGCLGSPTAPWHTEIFGQGFSGTDGCVRYSACPAAYPVVFCTTTGLGHAWQAERAIPAFTLFFKELGAPP